MKLNFKHAQTKEQAVAHVKKMLTEARGKIAEAKVEDLEEKWDGDVLQFAFTAQGQHISGTLEVRDHEFELYVKLPLALKLFEKRIEKMLMAQAQSLGA